MAIYLDSSAIVKLVVQEAESAALRRYLRSDARRVSCALARVDVARAVRPQGAVTVTRARTQLGRIVTYDARMAQGATALGLPAVSPR